jgi:hypothetical protein
MVFGSELRLRCDLMFVALTDNELSAACYLVDLDYQIHDNYHIVQQHLKIARDSIMTRYVVLANLVGYQEDDRV